MTDNPRRVISTPCGLWGHLRGKNSWIASDKRLISAQQILSQNLKPNSLSLGNFEILKARLGFRAPLIGELTTITWLTVL